jgi:hypothetical protein
MALGAVVALGGAGDAHAQEWEPDTHRSGAGADMTLWSAEFVGTITPVVGFGNFGVSENFYIDAYLPFAVWVDGPRFALGGFGGGGENRATIGNPTIAFRYVDKAGIVRWFIGGGAGIPLTTVDDADMVFTDLSAIAAGAGYNAHYWLPDYLPLHATGGVDIRVVDPLSIQMAFEPMLFLELDAPGGDAAEHAVQGRVGLEGRANNGIGGGFWLKSVWFVTDNASGTFRDNFQFALEPYFAYTGDAFFLRAGFLLALDEPYGFGFDTGGTFSGRLMLGGSW